jgi:hypothetical protein
MPNKMRVDIELVLALKEAISCINKNPIEDIQFYKNGKPLKMKNLSEFHLTGLANVDYVMMEFWRKQNVSKNKLQNKDRK